MGLGPSGNSCRQEGRTTFLSDAGLLSRGPSMGNQGEMEAL